MKRSTILRTGCVTLALLAVSACGGSNSGSNPGPVETTPDSTSYAEMAQAIGEIRGMGAGAEETAISAMPSAGRGTYVGGMSVAHSDGSRMNAQMVLRADFEQGLVDGHLTNFADARRGDIQGQLDMQGAQITGSQLTGRFEGELQDSSGLSPASAEIWGGFRGEGSEFMSGQVVLTHGSRALDGDFITMRPEPIQVD